MTGDEINRVYEYRDAVDLYPKSKPRKPSKRLANRAHKERKAWIDPVSKRVIGKLVYSTQTEDR